MFQRLRPLKLNTEGKNLRKKQNFSKLEVVPFEPEVEVKQGRAVWCLRSPEKRSMENDDCGRSCTGVGITRVRTLLKQRCCSVAASADIRYSFNDREKTKNIYRDKKDNMA